MFVPGTGKSMLLASGSKILKAVTPTFGLRLFTIAFSLLIPAFAAGANPPPRFVLVGDSTVAPVNGWGPGFCALLTNGATCLNLAKNGRSSGSYRAEGLWAGVTSVLKDRNEASRTWVLIQFGHNDQPGKPGRSTDLATEFPANMRRYVREVREAGANPVLITPLTRRSFRNGRVTNDLEAWADATRKVAVEEMVPVLELNAESLAAVQKMGPVEANTMAMTAPPESVAATAASGNSAPAPKTPADPGAPVFDYTHLGPKGSAFFGRLVAGELTAAVPSLAIYFSR
jgi:lysophospholipase L1-like esterase